ncbi:hypothetical protein PGT21_007945 [Puccinia graminis f. sp. tritici]|uniref:Uncharacterized protein n=1 Tax=Puccinia graminis f. sp. tritici TaxID=56615 RepID=A0A5B0PT62_PUCGR|nr:hypothetical protein PGT21_007945 [Puccinia graminis f. sp. tritici]
MASYLNGLLDTLEGHNTGGVMQISSGQIAQLEKWSMTAPADLRPKYWNWEDPAGPARSFVMHKLCPEK